MMFAWRMALLVCLLESHDDTVVVVVPSVVLRAVDEASIATREAGTIAQIAVREGHVVKEGQLLAQIDDAETRLIAERAAVEAGIARDRAENDFNARMTRKTLAVAEAVLARAVQAVEQFPKSVSQTEIDRLRLTVERDQLAVAQADHEQRLAEAALKLREIELSLARLRLERCRVIAPFDGIVVELKRRAGEWVEPGQDVARILRVDRLQAEGFLDAPDAGRDLVGHRAILIPEPAGIAEAVFEGTIVFVSPELNPVNGQVLVRAEIDNANLVLRPGRRGTLRIEP